MNFAGSVLFVLGAVIALCATAWAFVVVYRENPVLAVLCLFMPLGLLVAVVFLWPRQGRGPLALWLLGFTSLFCGMVMRTPGQ